MVLNIEEICLNNFYCIEVLRVLQCKVANLSETLNKIVKYNLIYKSL